MTQFYKYFDINKKTSLAFPSFIHQRHDASCERTRGDRGENEAMKIAGCQRKKKLGWMGKHARHTKALGPSVLILSNADFLWVREVAKSASSCVCVSVNVCVYNMCVCICV